MKYLNLKIIPTAVAIAVYFLCFSTSYCQENNRNSIGTNSQNAQVLPSPNFQTIEVFPGTVGFASMGISVNGAPQGHILNYTLLQAGGNPPGIINVSGSGTVVGNSIGFGAASFQLNVSQTTQHDYGFIFNYNTNQGVQSSLTVFVRVIYRADSPCDGTDITVNQNFSNTTQSFHASNNLASESKIFNSNINFKAGNRIRLYPGFHAKPGSTFNAKIQGCTQNRETNKPESFAKELEKKEPNIVLFPNPVTDILNFKSDQDISSWQITNQFGLQPIIGGNEKSNTNVKITITNYPSGIYFLKIILKDGKIVTKTISKK